MVEKVICDKCKKDIDKNKQFEIEIYDVKKEESLFKEDLCENCKKKILKKIKEL